MKLSRLVAYMIAAGAVMVAAFLFSLAVGAAQIPLGDVKAFLIGAYSNDNTTILREIRFPRVVASALAGTALAVSGAYMQGMTKNPLASPSLFGITAGASAMLSFVLAFVPGVTYYGVLFAALGGSIFAGFLVFAISMSGRHGLSNNKTILAGAAVSTLLYAISDGIALRFSTTKQMTMWAASGLIGTTMDEIMTVLPILVVGLVLALYFAGKLTLLSLDEEIALSLGENVGRLRVIFFFLVTFLTGASVAMAGGVVFVGLVVPHLVRRIVGSDYKRIVPMTMVVGAIFMMLADTAARVVNAPYETPVTAVMALVSFPVFLYVVKRGEGLL